MLRIVALVEKRDDLSREEFEEYWYETHVPLVTEIPQLRRYTTGIPLKPEEAPYDGIAQLFFDSTADIRAAFETEAGKRVLEDEANFTADGYPKTFVVDRDVQYDESGE
ncbi:EthD family reductase [Halobacteriales archaeon Cl-PHB]